MRGLFAFLLSATFIWSQCTPTSSYSCTIQRYLPNTGSSDCNVPLNAGFSWLDRLLSGTGSVASANSNSLVHASACAMAASPTPSNGSTADAWIAAAIAQLPSSGGLIDARSLQGAQTLAALVTVPNGVTLQLGAATYTCSVLPCINVAGGKLKGAGRDTSFGGPKGTIIQGSGGVLVEMTQNRSVIEDLQIIATASTSSNVGILVQNGSSSIGRWQILRVNLVGNGGRGIGIHTVAALVGTIEDSEVDTWARAIQYDSQSGVKSNDVVIFGSRFLTNTDALYAVDVDDLQLYGNDFESNAHAAVYDVPASGGNNGIATGVYSHGDHFEANGSSGQTDAIFSNNSFGSWFVGSVGVTISDGAAAIVRIEGGNLATRTQNINGGILVIENSYTNGATINTSGGGQVYEFTSAGNRGVKSYNVNGSFLFNWPAGVTFYGPVQTNSANIARSGKIRFANGGAGGGDEMCWRNATNTADGCLYLTGNNRLFSSYAYSGNGHPLYTENASNSDAAGSITVTSATSASYSFQFQYSDAPICTLTPTSPSYTGSYWVTVTNLGGNNGFGQVTANLARSGTQTFNYLCTARD